MALIPAIFLPVIAGIVMTSRMSGPDLFDLTPVVSRSDRYVILAWPELERARRALNAGGISSGTMVRALGYMMEADRPIRNGERVRSFVLLPDAGNAAHPAHRFGDQMIDVRLDAGNEALFSGRSLVWAWGTLQMLPGNPSGEEPLYVLEHARTEPAKKADIEKYFK